MCVVMWIRILGVTYEGSKTLRDLWVPKKDYTIATQPVPCKFGRVKTVTLANFYTIFRYNEMVSNEKEKRKHNMEQACVLPDIYFSYGLYNFNTIQYHMLNWVSHR